MNKKLIPLIVIILAIPASQAATTFSFNNLRFIQFGSVNMGATFTFDSTSSLANDSITANFTLTDDFDTDGTNETLTFGLTATAVAPVDSNLSLNGNGIVGIGDVIINAGEAINYTVTVGEVETSSGAAFAASFDGFTGGNVNIQAEESFDANGENFTVALFNLSSPSETLLLDNVSGNIFTAGLNFNITVEAVPEPSSTALLGLGALAFLARRRR